MDATYTKYFILLSFKPINEEVKIGRFIPTNFNGLFEILTTLTFENNVLKEYKVLLNSMINKNINKECLIEICADILSKKENHSLNKLQLLNNYYPEI
jgi:hypothetical protein